MSLQDAILGLRRGDIIAAQETVKNVGEMNEYLRLLYETIIDHNCRQQADGLFHPGGFVGIDLATALCADLIRAAKFTRQQIDLSPWPVLDIYNARIGGHGRSRTVPDFEKDEAERQHQAAVADNAHIVLMAIPRTTAFTQPRGGQTPIAYAIQQGLSKRVLEALIIRGGFSEEDWRSGNVMSLIGRDESLVDTIVNNDFEAFHAHINMKISIRGSHSNGVPRSDGTVLHLRCREMDLSQDTLGGLQLLVGLGADPKIRDSLGRTPSQVIESRLVSHPHYLPRPQMEPVLQYLKRLE
jgi:hypothetical protein